jgi:uncharacterized protein YunC (DUF1805 family)
MESSDSRNAVEELVDTLWLERRLLEFLLYKLVQANLMLMAGNSRFVQPALREVDQVIERVRQAENYRGTVVSRLAQEWNKPVASLTLEALAVEGPGWAQPLFQEHREGFLRLVNEIERITLENRRLAAVNIDSIRGTLDMLGGQQSNIYDASGRAESRERLPMKIDEVM